MPKVYTRRDERLRFTLVTDSGVAMTAASQGSVVGGVADLFSFLPAKRRAILLEKLNALQSKMLAEEAAAATNQTNPSTHES